MTDHAAEVAPDARHNHHLLLIAIFGIAVLYLLAMAAGLEFFQPPKHEAGAAKPASPALVMVVPFALLLAAIAIFPLVPSIAHWWEKNLHKFLVAAGLGVITVAYYLLAHGTPRVGAVLSHAFLDEYIPFIILLFSLYTISGGIRIECDLAARPAVNAGFLIVGGILASLIGTTGAAMLLIRPLLETNSERKHVKHTLVFFIFIVCNCGGCLTPLGDPPLFLGYLSGVDFWWTLRLWPQWLFVNGMLVVIYLIWDRFFAYPREAKKDIARDERRIRPLRFSGWVLNGLLLIFVVAAVAFLDPSKAFPGTAWHAQRYLREVVLLVLVAMSLALGARAPRQANKFTFGAIVEVAALFFGIFVCMQPALEYLEVHGGELGINTPARFFWCTGSLSSVLDNAPTYAVYFEAAKSMPVTPDDETRLLTGEVVSTRNLAAVSLGAVFMGSMTYIGNGPNFMVRTIAEMSGVKMPSFFGYVAYSVVVLLPLFAVVVWAMI